MVQQTGAAMSQNLINMVTRVSYEQFNINVEFF